MIDAANLDKLDQLLDYGPLWLSTSRLLITTAREAIALHALIDAHNARCTASCSWRRTQTIFSRPKPSFICPQTPDLHCPDCPRLGMIDVAPYTGKTTVVLEP